MKKKKGFTLIELLVVIAIIAVLAAYAIPNYRQYVVRSKRVEAQSKLLEMAGMFEKFYVNTNAYPTAIGQLNLTASFITWDDYTLSITSDAAGWTLTATAINGQALDDTPPCPTINFNNLGQKFPLVCWGE